MCWLPKWLTRRPTSRQSRSHSDPYQGCLSIGTCEQQLNVTPTTTPYYLVNFCGKLVARYYMHLQSTYRTCVCWHTTVRKHHPDVWASLNGKHQNVNKITLCTACASGTTQCGDRSGRYSPAHPTCRRTRVGATTAAHYTRARRSVCLRAQG
jgi:hypothetical protein